MRIFTISAAVLIGSAMSASQAQQVLPNPRSIPTGTQGSNPLSPSSGPKVDQAEKGMSGPGMDGLVSGGSDGCATATPIAGPGPFLGDNLGAGTDGPPACGAFGADVWYDWTAGATGPTTAALCGVPTNYDTTLEIRDTAACFGAVLGCSDDACPGFKSAVTFPAVIGSVYKIRIGGFGGSTGSYELVISAPMPPPANDSCATPTLYAGGVVAWSNVAATNDGPPVSCAVIGQDIWYTWNASCTGVATFTLCPGGELTPDTVIEVFPGAGCPAPGTAIACDDDTCSAPAFGTSRATFACTSGSDYTLRLGGFSSTTGSGFFEVTCAPPPPPPGPCDILDDGTSSASVGTNVIGHDILWMHSQGDVSTTTVVKSISTAWGSPVSLAGPPNGSPARVGIWSDPNNDGDPTDAVLIQEVATTVANTNTDMFQTVNLSPSVLISGRYFIGASTAAAVRPAPLDQTGGSAGGLVWIVGSTTGALDYNNLAAEEIPPLDEDAVAPGRWLLRCDCKDIEITEMCGSGPMTCPCGNDGLPLNGCASSAAPGGAHLAGSGNPIVSADTVSVIATDVRRGNPTLALFFSGSEGPQNPVNDGLLCAGTPICRLWQWKIPGPGGGTITLAGPGATTIPPNVSISQRSADLGRSIQNGETRVYTVWYRDPPAFGCAGATSNYTNGLRILWSL